MKNKKKSNTVRNLIILAAVVVFVLFSVIRIAGKINMGARRGFGAVYNVGAIVLKKEPVFLTINLQGTVEGDPQVRVYPIEGGKFIRNAVSEGAMVAQDQPLAYIDRNTPGTDYLPEPVTSPIAGLVIRLYFIDKGIPITPNDPVAEIANPRRIKLVLNVGEEQLLNVAANQKAEIYSLADNSRKIDGVVDAVTPFVDVDTQTGEITVKAVNTSNSLKIGATVGVNINIGSRIAFMVPDDAIVMGLNRATVFLVQDNKAKLVEIKTGYTANGYTEIISDQIHEGDTLVTVGSFKLFDGAAVKIGTDKGV